MYILCFAFNLCLLYYISTVCKKITAYIIPHLFLSNLSQLDSPDNYQKLNLAPFLANLYSLPLFWCTCMANNIMSVQINGGLLSDIIPFDPLLLP